MIDVMARVGRTNANRTANRLRIIGGRWRGAPILFPDIEAVRPSPDRVRETLFNWLQGSILGAACLDLFAGSGALGLEALSRGARCVTFVEREPALGRHLSATVQKLGAADAATIHVENAEQFLRRPPQPYEIVFLDPPFASGVQEVCDALARGWLASEAWVYLERPADASLPTLPNTWSVYRSKRAGRVGYHLLHVRREDSP